MAKTTIYEKAARIDRANLEAAQIILSDPAQTDGLMFEWAHAIIDGGGIHSVFCADITKKLYRPPSHVWGQKGLNANARSRP